MNDFLLEVGQNPKARKLVKTLGLPIPLPEPLRRDRGAYPARPLAEQRVLVGGKSSSELTTVIASALASAGASALVDGESALVEAFAAPAEAYGRPAKPVTTLREGERVEALLLDATQIHDPAGLRALYDFFHAHLSQVSRSGRIVVIGRPVEATGAELAMAEAALEGFIRSVAKEVGKNGVTANLIRVERGAENRLEGVLRFVLSRRSAFVTGQPIDVTNEAKGGNPALFVRPFDKRVVLVTGAARGIGEATARRFAEEGAHVVCLDRPEDDGPTSRLARELGGTPLLVNMSAEDAPVRIAEVLRERGGVDVVVHNAGITRDKTLARMSQELWDQTIAVNLTAIARTNAALAPDVLKDGGRIVCLSSIAGIAGNVGQTNYAASKAGVIGFVRAESRRLATRGITVNAVAPGFIETRLTAAIPFAIREVARRMSALAQGGRPEDVGEAILFLSSPGAQGITGRVLRVCGGSLVGA